MGIANLWAFLREAGLVTALSGAAGPEEHAAIVQCLADKVIAVGAPSLDRQPLHELVKRTTADQAHVCRPVPVGVPCHPAGCPGGGL